MLIQSPGNVLTTKFDCTQTAGKGPPELVTGSRDGACVRVYSRVWKRTGVRQTGRRTTTHLSPSLLTSLSLHHITTSTREQAACACGTCECGTPCCRWSRRRGRPSGTAGPWPSVRTDRAVPVRAPSLLLASLLRPLNSVVVSAPALSCFCRSMHLQQATRSATRTAASAPATTTATSR